MNSSENFTLKDIEKIFTYHLKLESDIKHKHKTLKSLDRYIQKLEEQVPGNLNNKSNKLSKNKLNNERIMKESNSYLKNIKNEFNDIKKKCNNKSSNSKKNKKKNKKTKKTKKN